MPIDKAAQEIADIVQFAPPSVAIPVSQWVQNLVVQNKSSLLIVADTLRRLGELDQAEAMLWRGIRLYEEDKQVWEAALICALQHVFYPGSYVEWQRARHRLDYLLSAIPGSLRDEFAGYSIFSGRQGSDLLEGQQLIMWLWQKQRLVEARYALLQLSDRLSGYSLIPDYLVGWLGWSMLGLGLFDTLKRNAAIQRRYPAWAQVATWFCGEPLPTSLHPVCRNALLLLTRWAQNLLAHGRTSFSTIWQALLAARAADENLVFYAMFAATFGLKRSAIRKRVERWLDNSGGRLFLPYLFLLCIAAARLNWDPLAWQLWERINLFEVEFARRRELQTFLRSEFSPGQRRT